MSAKITSIIICDDVRREINNKEILIGVYSGSITVPSYPATLRLALWIEMETEQKELNHWAIKIETPSGNPPIEVEFDAETSDPGTSSLTMGGLPIRLEHDGEVVVSAKLNDGAFFVVKRKPVQRLTPPK